MSHIPDDARHRAADHEDTALYLAVRRELAEELAMHDTSPAHADACLCGGWDGQGIYWDHLADAALSVLYGEAP